MVQILQHRRNTTVGLQSELGSIGEIIIDTTKNTVVVMDGATNGGTPLAKASDIPTDVSDLTDTEGLLGGGNIGVGNQLISDENNNTFSIANTGDVVFSGEIPGGVNRGLVWDYGANVGGGNSMIRQDQNGLSVRAWTEGAPAELYSASVNIVTNQDANERIWEFDGEGDLNLPDNGGIVFDRADTSIRVGMGFHIASGEGISLDAIDQTAILTLTGAGNGPVNQTYNKTNGTLYTGNTFNFVTVENLGGTWFVLIDGDAKYTSNDLLGWALSTGPGPVPAGALSNGYKSWYFGPDGSITFPDSSVQITAGAGDRVVSAPTTSKGATGDKIGDLAYTSTHHYYCTADYVDGVADIWVRSAWGQTTWS